MCGIAGAVFANTDRRPEKTLISRMCAALRHRGPDDGGAVIGDGFGLGMRRLAVIDLPGGHQPIFNEDRTVAVVFNGEIYNFRSLRQQLESRGHTFQTTSDTEVIVHLYEDYGDECVHHLHGMFALAVWDYRSSRLLLARDRLGVKPLYYFCANGRLLFGSEIKAILQDRQVPRTMNLAAIDQLLTFGHFMPPETCFSDIQELPAASTLVFQRGGLRIDSYWDLHFDAIEAYDETEVASELLQQLRAAVERRLVSDVPLGAFLSGGIDSGIVVALMSQLCREPVKTFSIGFDDPSFSELPYARAVARQYSTDHHEFVVKPQVCEILDQLIRHHDSPFYDTSAIPTYHVSRLAREHVTVALSGDGGDEMFAGYNIYLANKAAGYYRRVPRLVRDVLISPLTKLVPESSRYINKGRVLREFVTGAPCDTLSRYVRWATKVKRETRERLYENTDLVSQLAFSDEQPLRQLFERQSQSSDLGRLLYLGTKSELAGDMLVKVDRMSMAHSLEVRSPLLDHTLFEFAARLPDRAKLRGWSTKHLLRKVAAQLLPSETLKRPKRGFSVPLDRWLRGDLADYVSQILLDPRTVSRGLFRTQTVREFLREHTAGRRSFGREIWTLLTIELWQRSYIDEFSYFIDQPEPLEIVTDTLAEKGKSCARPT